MSDSLDVVLVQKLSKKEWLLRNRFELAEAAQKVVGDKNATALKADPQAKTEAYPLSEDQMVDLELAMLTAQIALQEKISPSVAALVTEAAVEATTPAEYQVLMLAELDKGMASFMFRMLSSDQQRQAKAARAAIADADLVVATKMFACYQTQTETST